MGTSTFERRRIGYVNLDVSGPHLSRKRFSLISIVVAMFLVLALAGLVVLYVAFPHRGEQMPRTPWVGDAMRKGVEMLPTLDNQRERERERTTSDA